MSEKITLSHGSGGVQTNKLINEVFFKHFNNALGLAISQDTVIHKNAG